MELEVLKSLVIVFFASAIAVYVLHALRIPSLVGFLVSGVLIGPNGLGIIENTHQIEILAEIGVVVLLFTIGVEFSLARLMTIRRAVLQGGSLQMGLTAAAMLAAAYAWTGSTPQALFFGFITALSSTAIVLKILSEQGEMDTPHGRMMLGILIFQDLCVVPLMLVTPALAGADVGVMSVGADLLKAALIVGAVVMGARWAAPALLNRVVRTRSRELFIMTILLLCMGTAMLTSWMGLSLALGAFLAGLVVSESEYAHQAMADILPFKESFMGLFFVSVGMLMDFRYLAGNPGETLLAVGLIFVLKALAAAVAAYFSGASHRAAIQSGLGLAQVGEFSFVLAMAGRTLNIIPDQLYQLFLVSSVITMISAPFVLRYSGAVASWLMARHPLKMLQRLKEDVEHTPTLKRHGHVIIVGFGVNGRNLGRVLRETGIPYAVLEMNSDTVKREKHKGEPIYFGDATSVEVLRKLGLERARLLVIAISDATATRRITSIARGVSSTVGIIARTRYVGEVDDLHALGADEVIPEEFETSIEIFARVLGKYQVPGNMINALVADIRKDSYQALRGASFEGRKFFEAPEIEMEGYKVPEGSVMAGRSIAELEIRKRTGGTVVAVRRGAEIITNPPPGFRFNIGDIVLFTGDREELGRALECMGDDLKSCPPRY